jgi:curved DNA-binding protein CbpA
MNRAPRLTPGCEIQTLPLTPGDAFLLSRIDGTLHEEDLAALTGLPSGVVARVLDRLSAMGAIEFDRAPGPAARPAQTPPAPPAQPIAQASPTSAAQDGVASPRRTTRKPTIDRPTPSPDPRSAVRSAALRREDPEPPEEVDLDEPKQRRISELYARLDDVTYYELFGLTLGAGKKEIKRAYYAIAPEFHPDRFFRKRLGAYRPKIEAIFSRLTLAHDVLISKERRAEYDEYLAVTKQNRDLQAVLDRPVEVASVVAEVDDAAYVIATEMATPAPRPIRELLPPEALESRRQAFARKLAAARMMAGEDGSITPPPQRLTPSSPPPPPPGEALRIRYEAARSESLRRQIDRYVVVAEQSLEQGDYASASNAYRIAVTLAPDDEILARACQETSRLAATQLAEGFMKQAELEARQNRWTEAALSYAKACEGRPDDPALHDRAALATVNSGNNARRAIEFARRAVELSPKTAEFHVTLARGYFAAGFEKSALSEIERATQLAPNDARIRDLVARARDGAPKDGKVG